MMKTKLPLKQAALLAEKIIEALSPGCQTIQEAGSVRRRKSTVGDIEIVAIPLQAPAPGAMLDILTGEYSETVSALDGVIEELLAAKPHFRRGDKNGQRLKNFVVDLPGGRGVSVDLFLTTPSQWGYILALRTGSRAFNLRWAVRQLDGGELPNRFRFQDGRLTLGGRRIETPDEREMFRQIEFGWREPWERQ